MADIKMQIIVGSELEGAEFVPLRVMNRGASESDVREFVRFFNSLKVDSEKQMADTIMDVSIAENRSLYGRIKEEDPTMSKALAELMKDEIEEQVKQRVEEQVKQKVEQSMNIRNEDIATKMLRKSKPVSEIVEFTNVGLDRIKEIARTIGVVPVI